MLMILACRCLSLTEQSNLSRKLIQFLLTTKPTVVNCIRLSFPNQLGLAAGMDKNGRFPKTSASLGFGHVEIGTVTPKHQIGESQAQAFSLPKIQCFSKPYGI